MSWQLSECKLTMDTSRTHPDKKKMETDDRFRSQYCWARDKFCREKYASESEDQESASSPPPQRVCIRTPWIGKSFAKAAFTQWTPLILPWGTRHTPTVPVTPTARIFSDTTCSSESTQSTIERIKKRTAKIKNSSFFCSTSVRVKLKKYRGPEHTRDVPPKRHIRKRRSARPEGKIFDDSDDDQASQAATKRHLTDVSVSTSVGKQEVVIPVPKSPPSRSKDKRVLENPGAYRDSLANAQIDFHQIRIQCPCCPYTTTNKLLYSMHQLNCQQVTQAKSTTVSLSSDIKAKRIVPSAGVNSLIPKFAQNNLLKEGMIDAPYTCLGCGKSFGVASSLTGHKATCVVYQSLDSIHHRSRKKNQEKRNTIKTVKKTTRSGTEVTKMPSVAGEEKFGTRKKRRVLSTTGTGQQSQGLQSGTLVKDVVADYHSEEKEARSETTCIGCGKIFSAVSSLAGHKAKCAKYQAAKNSDVNTRMKQKGKEKGESHALRLRRGIVAKPPGAPGDFDNEEYLRILTMDNPEVDGKNAEDSSVELDRVAGFEFLSSATPFERRKSAGSHSTSRKRKQNRKTEVKSALRGPMVVKASKDTLFLA